MIKTRDIYDEDGHVVPNTIKSSKLGKHGTMVHYEYDSDGESSISLNDESDNANDTHLSHL